MFGRKNQHMPQNKIDSMIGGATRIKGDLVFSGGLRIDGHIQGNVVATTDAPSTLVISKDAVVEGEIRVSHVLIDGTVKGPVFASEYVELLPGANITGDVSYKTLEIRVGAVVDGRMVHLVEESAEVVKLHRTGTDA